MCLCIFKRHFRILTAEKDIAVYKIIYNDNRSFVHKFQYKPNTLYRLSRPLEALAACAKDFYKVEEGFHSFCKYAHAMHDYRNYNFEIAKSLKLVQFFIPEGAKYISGTYGPNEGYTSESIRSGNLERYIEKA